MEYFILALIGKAGLGSLYAFQQQAGLQPGGIRPALQRLEAARLITRGESSARRRRDLSLTDKGEDFLNNTYLQCLQEYPESESVLRAACVSMLMGDWQHAASYLTGMSKNRRQMAEEKSMEAERLGKTQRDSLARYAWMRTLCEARRRDAESAAFETSGRSVKENHQPDAHKST